MEKIGVNFFWRIKNRTGLFQFSFWPVRFSLLAVAAVENRENKGLQAWRGAGVNSNCEPD